MTKADIGKTLYGVLDAIFHPELIYGWGGGFNAQIKRQTIFGELYVKRDFKLIVETGTYRGTTTNFMSSMTGLPIYTVESERQFYAFSKLALLRDRNIKVTCGDSRNFLDKILCKFINKDKFFYLDAHDAPSGDVPLIEEINKILCVGTDNDVIMIDDFMVPNDNYGYDIIPTTGQPFNVKLISQVLQQYDIDRVYFPKAKAEEESGMKRGCVVISKSNLDDIESLRRFDI